MDKSIDAILNYFPKAASEKLKTLCIPYHGILQEIRIRKNKPICFTVSGENIIPDRCFLPDSSAVDELFMNVCSHSVYAHQNDINSGFVTISGGHRVGVCGTGVYNSDKIVCIKDITSLNFRIARQFIGCAQQFYSDESHSILLIGPPSSGKTTLLRDFARIKSDKHIRTVIADERLEICGGESINFDFGTMTDCILGVKKSRAIECAVRTLSPQVIVFDEIGTEDEYEGIKSCLNCGVDVITSVHSHTKESFLKREFCRKIVKSEVFDTYIFLGKKPGEIEEIIKGEINL